MKFIELMKRKRYYFMWTQAEAADRLGIQRSYYARVECGDLVPSVALTKRIATVFRIKTSVWHP